MAMNFLKLRLLCSTAIIIITFSHPLISLLANCSRIHHHTQPSDTTTQGSLFEGKTRLGSTPPSCHNKCNQCHPCLAVEVPSMPSHDDRFQPGLNRVMPVHYFDSSPSNKYSNYKPLGWKCRCGDHFFNP